MNYYTLFGIPVTPAVVANSIAENYFALQRKYHPDFHTQSAEDEKNDALIQSADINKAFNVFQSRDKTLEYFLEVMGVIVAGEKFTLPPDFLMNMMDINESLESKGDEVVASQVVDTQAALYHEVKHLIEDYDPAKSSANDLYKLKTYYYKKKYLDRILDRLDD